MLQYLRKKDKRTIYNMIYRDGKGGASYVKRFAVTSYYAEIRNMILTNESNKLSSLVFFG